MHQDQTSLAALIGSRICHDLINPIGAISNGLELVAMAAPDPNGPEMSLIQQSCDNATARIRFFRIAFGSAGDQRPVPGSEARTTLLQHYLGTRISPEWAVDQDLPRNNVQLVYLSILCAETALTQGGSTVVAGDNHTITITANGPSIVMHDRLWNCLNAHAKDDDFEMKPAQVQFGLLAALTHDAGLPLQIESDSTTLKLSVPLDHLPV